MVARCGHAGFLSGRTSYFICRCLLGLIEGGFIPDNILYLSYWYTSSELPIRLSFFWTSYQMTSIVSSFLAYGILHMRGVNGLPGWAWLFALEGLLTGLIGVVSWFYLPPGVTQTASALRGKNGWFSEREEKILVNRVLRDDPSKGDMHNRQGLSLTMLWKCLCDKHLWPIYLLGLSWIVPAHPITAYLTLQLRSLGFTTFETNLLTIPAAVIFIINLLVITWVSEKLNDRFLVASFSQIWALPILISLEILPSSRSAWVGFTLSTLLYAMPYAHALIVAAVSRNAGSVRTRTVASALYNMSVQTGSIYGTQIYREEDKPLYRTGNKALIALVCYNFVLFLSTKAFYVWTNRKRDEVWSNMGREEKKRYLETTEDEGIEDWTLDLRIELVVGGWSVALRSSIQMVGCLDIVGIALKERVRNLQKWPVDLPLFHPKAQHKHSHS